MFNKILVSIGLLAVATFAVAKNDFPAVSHDGLHLMPDTKLRAVYMKPGAVLSEYDKVYMVDAYVAFAKNWKRDHNNEEAFDQRINDKQMKEIATFFDLHYSSVSKIIKRASDSQFKTWPL